MRTPQLRPLVVGAVAVLVWSSPDRALAYGVYEEQILGLEYVRRDPGPIPNLDAPELSSQAFFTPAPVDEDQGLAAIEGTLNPASADLADMYFLLIGSAGFDVTEFFATMSGPFNPNEQNPSNQIEDPVLFLFDAIGHPVVGIDDIDDIDLEPTIPAGTITVPGLYTLAITGKGYVPVDADGDALFDGIPQGLMDPINPDSVLASWQGTHTQSGRYRVNFGEKLGHFPIPEPSTALLLGCGLAALALRRRRAR